MVEQIRQGDIPGVQLRRRRRLAVAPEVAWRWLTEEERLRRWLAPAARVEPGAGGSLTLESTTPEGEPLRERAATLELEPPRRWVLSFERLDAGWRSPTRLTLSVVPAAGGAEIDIFQEGFEQLSLTTCLTVWEAYRRRWSEALERLAGLTGQPG